MLKMIAVLTKTDLLRALTQFLWFFTRFVYSPLLIIRLHVIYKNTEFRKKIQRIYHVTMGWFDFTYSAILWISGCWTTRFKIRFCNSTILEKFFLNPINNEGGGGGKIPPPPWISHACHIRTRQEYLKKANCSKCWSF